MLFRMTNRPLVTVELAPEFVRRLRRLFKKHHHVYEDVQGLVHQLQLGETPGDQVQGVGQTVYKVRLRSSDLGKGKSAGYRVIYYINTPERIILITMYIKGEFGDIKPEEIRRLIDELK